MSTSFFTNFPKTVFSQIKNKFFEKNNQNTEELMVRDIPEGSIIQIIDTQENQYEFTVHDHNRFGSFVKFTKFNNEDLLGEIHSKVKHPHSFPSSKFSIEMKNYKEEKDYSISGIKHIKILEKPAS